MQCQPSFRLFTLEVRPTFTYIHTLFPNLWCNGRRLTNCLSISVLESRGVLPRSAIIHVHTIRASSQIRPDADGARLGERPGNVEIDALTPNDWIRHATTEWDR